MLTRDDYLKIIDEVRNLEKGALDGYISRKLMPLKEENEFFIETLYKDIVYVLHDIGKPDEGDLVIENGDFAIEDGDLKVSGYQTNLHRLSVWLHMAVCEKLMTRDMENLKTLKHLDNFEWGKSIQNFEENVLNKDTYTIEYRKKLDEIRRSVKRERLENYDRPKFFKKLFIIFTDPDYWNLKFKIPGGTEVNISGMINNIRMKNKTNKLVKNIYPPDDQIA